MALEGEVSAPPAVGAASDGEAAYRAIFEATSDGLVINELDGTVVEVNPAFCAMHGFAREELIGRHPSLFIAPGSLPLLAEYVDAVRRGERFQARAADVRRDGTTFPVEVHGGPFTYRGRPHILGVVRDISARAQAYETLERRVAERTRELSALLEVSRNVASTLELAPLLGLILDQLGTVIDYTGAGILALESDEFTVLGYRGPLPPEQALALRFKLTREIGHWYVVQSKQPLLVADTWAQRESAREAFGEDGGVRTRFDYIRSWILAPLLHKDRVIGALSVEHAEPNHYSERDMSLARAIANQVAVAMENARLYQQAHELAALRERSRLARELHDSVTQALYALTLYTEASTRLLDDGDATTARQYLGEMRDTAREALDEMRLLIFSLRPPVLASEGLAAALRQRIEAVEGRSRGVEAALEVEGDARPTAAVEGALYRVAQEALNNALKHARARHVRVRLAQQPERTTLEIADDGTGFDLERADRGATQGLRGMRERAAEIGATLAVETAPGAGTRIRVEVAR